jgi:hypothetical protein
MLRKFTTLNVKDLDMNKIQSNISNVITPVVLNPILDFNIVKSVVLSIGDNLVNHKLNRAPLGWFVVRQRGLASLYDKQDSNSTPTVNYIITSDAAVTVDIYFF